MTNYSYLNNANTAVIEDLYQQYRQDRNSVDPSWQQFFEGYEFASQSDSTGSHVPENFVKEFGVINLIGAYRQRGHLLSKTNPVRPRRKHIDPINLAEFHLSTDDLQTVFQAGQQLGLENATLAQIIDNLEQTYCGTIGVEYAEIQPHAAELWLQHKMESCQNKPNFNKEEKRYILEKLNQAVTFENFLHTKFVGQKRFSLEGAESIIPALDTIVETGGDLGIEELVIGMAHRGRLNVLANIMGKSYLDLFTEFLGKPFEDPSFEGDVKYHLGYSSDRVTRSGKNVHLSLTPNPSHLEAVNPVAEGVVRSKLESRYNNDMKKIAPILIHGDASIAGQGIVYEVLQMSTLPGYKTGGTIHVVLNNQVGFTTNYKDARSSIYCTDVAKTTFSPVFHVNGDDPEAVTYVIQLAMEYRQKFHKDVFVDILCYRKYGHNEGDEPRFTQPVLYNIIARHPNPKQVYLQHLLENKDITQEESKTLEDEFKNQLQNELDEAKNRDAAEITSFLEGQWAGIRLASVKDFEKSPDTGVAKKTLLKITDKVTEVPEGLAFFKKIKKLFQDRHNMVYKTDKIDWGMAELLSYGSLLLEGHTVRISGQDCERGTFSHRHAVVRLEDSEEQYIPLQHLDKKQEEFHIYNSLLSEYGVLGFEYGYSMARPSALTIWEAQFGDFANGAQIIIDQFIAAAETKWQRMSGLVMLLPHGYEGQGPEHSSARLERFLSLCAGKNMQVINCTVPANIFHAFRRQLMREFRKPLIVMSPKSLLRHPKCVSSLEDFMSGSKFQEVLDDPKAKPKSVKRILFCSGKLYYELLEKQETDKRNDIAIVRLEQLYPFPDKQVKDICKRYKNATDYAWVQEEPENMGAWKLIMRKFDFAPIRNVSRKESATTAVGFTSVHLKQQEALIEEAFA